VSTADTTLDDFLASTRGGGPTVALRVVDDAPAPTAPTGVAVRRINGDDARTLPGLYRAMAAAWDFPDHFGMNKDAFDDCMGDLPEADGGYLTEVTAPAALLDRAPGELSWFIDSLAFYAGEYAPDRAFGVLLLATARQAPSALRRWRAAGASVTEVL
jgi:hypothetical protein